MPVVDIEPTTNHPMPYEMQDDMPATFLEEMAVAGNTVELQKALGAEFPELAEEDIPREKALIEAVLKSKGKKGKDDPSYKGKIDNDNTNYNSIRTPTVAFAAAAFIRAYGESLAVDAAKARSAITNKLLEIANCGDTKYELKALELLGKHSDIGIFTERSEVTINYKNPEDLEKAINERVKRLLNANVIDITPLTANIDEELGVFVDLPEKEETEKNDSETALTALDKFETTSTTRTNLETTSTAHTPTDLENT